MTSEQLVERFKNAIESNGGSFQGNTSAGQFSISKAGSTVKGGYTIHQQTLNVVITNLPLLVSCDHIKKKVKEVLGNRFSPIEVDFFKP